MRIRLGDLTIALNSPDAQLNDEWERLFAGWQSSAAAEAHLSISLAETLPPPPGTAPLFADPRQIVDVYAAPHGYLLYFHSGAFVRLQDDHGRGAIAPAALDGGQLEDVTYTALAPFLREHGYYLLHAFAASHKGRTILLCGGSGSGKTTTGASLLLHDWQLLANDVVLLQQQEGCVRALPTPGPIRVRPPTLFLLPALRHRPGRPHAPTASYIFAGEAVAGRGWGQPAPVDALYFTRIEAGAQLSILQPLERALALAHLVEESVDRWDASALDGHLALLQALAEQAPAYRLHLGEDVHTLPELLAQPHPTERS